MITVPLATIMSAAPAMSRQQQMRTIVMSRFIVGMPSLFDIQCDSAGRNASVAAIETAVSNDDRNPVYKCQYLYMYVVVEQKRHTSDQDQSSL